MEPCASFRRRSVALLSCIALSIAAAPALVGQTPPVPAADARFALVIGNGSYANSPLRNPPNDARDLATALATLGFRVSLLVDADLPAMNRAVGDFGDQIRRPDAVGLFYYAGHGVQYRGANYLVPAGSDIQASDELPNDAFNVEQVYAKMGSSGAAVNIVILEAGRDNPLPGANRAAERGLALVGAVQPPRSVILYSTAPGMTAAEGEGRNGVLTAALLRNIATPDLDVELMIRRVREEVIQATGGRQVPWHNSSLRGSGFAFAGRSGSGAEPAAGALAAAPEAQPGTLPFRTIKVDGAVEDWAGIEPAQRRQPSDPSPPAPLRAVEAMYLCRDDARIYVRYDLAGGQAALRPDRPQSYEVQIDLGQDDCLLLTHYWFGDRGWTTSLRRYNRGDDRVLATGKGANGGGLVEVSYPLAALDPWIKSDRQYAVKAKLAYESGGEKWTSAYLTQEMTITGIDRSVAAVAAGRAESATAAQSAASTVQPEEAHLQAVGFLGAGLVLNTDGAPNLSYGGGIRWSKYFNAITGVVLDAEFNHRGGYLEMNCADLSATIMFGRRLFAESGVYLSPIFSNISGDYGWNQENWAAMDLGARFRLGYHFPSIPGLSIGANVNLGLVDLTTDLLPVGYLLYVNQLNIHWGLFIAHGPRS